MPRFPRIATRSSRCIGAPLVPILAALLLVAAGPSAPTAARASAEAQEPTAAQQTETLRLDGLDRPVEILKDRWGIAHIYAETEHDLFFAQGWSAARDRLFQLEIWRRQATGTVAEILGERALERDVGTRLFRYRGDLEQELRHYHPRGPEIIGAFVEGINAYVDRALENPDLLSMEFELLGIEPGHWTPEVVISRHQGLLMNVRSELATGRAVAAVGPELVQELEGYPRSPKLELDPAVDGSLLSQDVLRLYNAFRGPIRFRPEDVVEEHRWEGEAAGAVQRLDRAAGEAARFAAVGAAGSSPAEARRPPASHEPRGWPRSGAERRSSTPGGPSEHTWDPSTAAGSNNWVVSGERSASGFPLMANDPHRVQAAPSLRYWVHLVGPGWNVIGGGEPVLPGVSIGHNEHGAWGLTVFQTDSEDLYVYETHPEDPERYRYGDGWERMRVIVDTIPVKGREPEVVEHRYTRHGPVVHRDTANDVAYAVRAAWMEPGGAPYLASLRMDQAESWEEFRVACSWSNIPGENMVWAGRDGTIGWQAVGIAPIRRSWSGLVPVPGDGRYEWDGYLPIEAKPHVVNPEQGFFATANNDLTPRDYPYMDAIGYEWSAPYRWMRATEVLGSGRRHTLRDMMRLQTDELSIPAREIVPALEHVSSLDDQVEDARRRLLAWDRVLDASSVAAGIYVAFERRLSRNLYDLKVPEAAREHVRSVPMTLQIAWLTAPDGDFGDDPVAGRDALLLRSLEEAVADLTEKLGPEMDGWVYGQEAYKHVLLRHPLSPAVDAQTRELLDVGPLPRGGYGYTLNQTGMGDNQTSGASFRIIVDTGDWDAAVGMNNPGQGGHPDHPHYEDLFELWARDGFHPAHYSREKVESVTGERIVLEPSS